MEYFVVCAVALGVSGLTLLSGFGLGAVLMPAFALFFPVPVAIAATAVVHLANNLFKVALVGRKADWSVVVRFALPGAAAAIAGAWLLNVFGELPPVLSYQISGKPHEVSPVALVIGLVIICFAFLDLLPRFNNLSFDRKYLGVGGLLSGFFGGNEKGLSIDELQMITDHARRDSVLKYADVQVEAKRRLMMGKIIPWGKPGERKEGSNNE
jgi:uncharacterized protein